MLQRKEGEKAKSLGGLRVSGPTHDSDINQDSLATILSMNMQLYSSQYLWRLM